MAATIQHEADGNILRTVPGFEALLPARFRTAAAGCEHCGADRRRADTYVLQGGGQGCAGCDILHLPDECSDRPLWKQVGRNCLADFLRSPDASGIAEWAEVLAGLEDEIKAYEGDDWGEGGGRQRESFTTLRLLTQVACCVRAGGWCSRTEAKNSVGRMATTSALPKLPADEKGDAELCYAQLACAGDMQERRFCQG